MNPNQAWPSQAYLTIAGKQVAITKLDIEYTQNWDSYESIGGRSMDFYEKNTDIIVTVQGVLQMNTTGSTFSLTTSNGCGSSCDNDNELAKDILALDMEKGDRLLRDYGVVDETGMITEKGKSVLLNLLLRENKAKIVTALEKLEADEDSEVVAPSK